MTKKTKLLSLLLAVCMTASLLTLPAGAAGTFSDVADTETAVAVESLRLLGVLDGYGDGTFRPGATLTRAAFCKMSVYAMNASGELGRYQYTTVFPDVKPSYWASAYINMASKGKAIIAGYPDGKFRPERIVTVGQAVTILMRQLGYKDDAVGGVWPAGYMSKASEVGLLDGVTAGASAALTRGQAARLFLNLLRSNNQDGTTYASKICETALPDIMLVSSAASGPDGQKTAMQAGSGKIYQMANKTSTGALNGCKGTLLLDKAGKVLTFVPDSVGNSKTVTIAKTTSSGLTDTYGTTYSIAGTVSAYYNGAEKTWSEVYSFLNPGVSITLYLGTSGGVEYVFVGSGTTASSAVIVYTKGSTAGFSSLTGGNSGYTIYKDGTQASAADLRPYDVATYSSATNTVRVCDTRITGYYEDCSPNVSNPTAIKVLGHTFTVLPTAADTLSKFSLGQQLTLLLTEDNQVAGAVAADGASGAAGNAAGIVRSVSESTATVDLLCGISITGSVSLGSSDVSRFKGQLAKVSSSQKGYLSLALLTGGVSGDLNTVKKTVGDKTLSDNVTIFEKTSSGLTAISLSQLTSASIPASQIIYAGTDWAGRVNVLVLVSTTAGDYIYGIAQYTYNSDRDSSVMQLTTPTNSYSGGNIRYDIPADDFIGAKLEAGGSSISEVLRLTKIANVGNSAWSGAGAVTVGGRTYTVPDGVLCYNAASSSWVTLNAAHAFSTTSTLYVDSYGIVRGVKVG